MNILQQGISFITLCSKQIFEVSLDVSNSMKFNIKNKYRNLYMWLTLTLRNNSLLDDIENNDKNHSTHYNKELDVIVKLVSITLIIIY